MKPLNIIFCVFLILGIIQGLVFGIVLLRNRGHHRYAQKFLAILMFFFAYRLTVELLKILGLLENSWFQWLFMECNWLYPGLIYLFVRAFIKPQYKFNLATDWWHFLPVIIEICITALRNSQYGQMGLALETIWTNYPISFFISTLLIVYYCSKGISLIHNSIKDGTLEKDPIKWLINFQVTLRNFSIIVFIIVLMDFLFLDYAYTRIYIYPIFIGFAGITYWLGIEGVSKRHHLF
jgi:hypothetical protein